MRHFLVVMLLAGCASAPSTQVAFSAAPISNTPLQVCWIDTGGTTVSPGYGTAGTPTAKQWSVTSPAILLRHPKGDLLIDTGISPNAAEEVKDLGGWRRFVFSQTAGRNVQRRSLVDSLKALGVTEVKAVILSHAHPDHAGGVALLPREVPVWVDSREQTFITEELASKRGVVVPAQASALEDRATAIAFTDAPYETWASHFDVFGDGSVVIVPTPGHTPGSIATFVNLDAERRFVHVGDLINMQESLERSVGKSWLMRTLTDEDEAGTTREVQRLVGLHAADPGLTILPAHDRPAYVALFGEDDGGTLPPCIASK